MWPLLSGGQAQTVAMHDAPVKEVAWISQMNLLVSGSWDKTLRCKNNIPLHPQYSFYMEIECTSPMSDPKLLFMAVLRYGIRVVCGIFSVLHVL
jgi:hypothetical protein